VTFAVRLHQFRGACDGAPRADLSPSGRAGRDSGAARLRGATSARIGSVTATATMSQMMHVRRARARTQTGNANSAIASSAIYVAASAVTSSATSLFNQVYRHSPSPRRALPRRLRRIGSLRRWLVSLSLCPGIVSATHRSFTRTHYIKRARMQREELAGIGTYLSAGSAPETTQKRPGIQFCS